MSELKLPRFTVWLADGDEGLTIESAVSGGQVTSYDCVILHPDQIRAENVGPRYGLVDIQSQQLAYVGLWCWASLRRQFGKDVIPDWPVFSHRIVSIDKLEDSDDFPTLPAAPISSVSSSPESMEAGLGSGDTPANGPTNN